MTAPTVAVTAKLSSFGGPALAGVVITATADKDDNYQGLILRKTVTATTDTNGEAVFNLFPNALATAALPGLGTTGSTYRFTASVPNGWRMDVSAQVPNVACDLHSIVMADDAELPTPGEVAGAVRYDIAQTLTSPQQAQARANIGFDAAVRAVALTGLSLATATAVTAADSVLVAFGKAQAQITALDTAKANLSGAAFTGAVSATGFTGPLTGNVTGNVSGSAGSVAASAITGTTLAANVVTSSLTAVGTIATGVWQGTAIADTYLATISTGGKVANSATTATSANTASAIVARDASGNFTAGTITAALSGNASTATTLATARNINGVTFNGSADITVTAAAGTLTGTTLAANVVNASLSGIIPYGGAPLIVGDDATTGALILKGSGSAGGAAVIVQNGGALNLAIGNRSSIVGGAYSSNPMIYGVGGLTLNISGTDRVVLDPSYLRNRTGSTDAYFGDGAALVTGAASGTAAVRSDNGDLLFSLAATEKARVSSSGLSVTGSISARNSTGEILAEDSRAVAVGIGGRLNMRARDDNGNYQNCGSIASWLADGTPGAYAADTVLYTSLGGALAERVRLFAAGGASLTGLLDLSNAASGQIKFPATQNPSADANTLDDYEEGTWTPTVNASGLSGAGYAAQTGRYVKMGRYVWVWGHVALNALTTPGGNYCRIEGLPFAVDAVDSAMNVRWANLTGGAAGNVPSAVAINGQTAINFFEQTVDGITSGLGMQGSRMTATTEFTVSGCYQVAS